MPDLGSHPVLLVAAIAVIAPLLAEIPIGFRLPTVVLEMVLGIVIGPHVLGLVEAEGLLGWLGGTLGLAALFFSAGLELDLGRVRGRPLGLGMRGWALSLVLALAAATLLHALPFVHAPLLIAAALATTAMGTLLPILRDGGELETKFGRFVIAAAAVGEFGPIILVSLMFTREYSLWQEFALMLAFVTVALGAALIALRARPVKAMELLTRTLHSSSQLPVRLSILLLAIFVVVSEDFRLEGSLGAFAGGIVVGLAARGEGGKAVREKIDAVTFGFLVPFFFVTSGIKFDLGGLLQPETMLLVPVFLILFLIVRGAPVFLYRKDIARGDRLPFALYAATTLPVVVAISEIGVRTGRLPSDIAAALVGAAMLSVLLFPAIAGATRGPAPRSADAE